jgi:biopolymer transport protein ExbB
MNGWLIRVTDFLSMGGPVVWILVLLSHVVVAITVLKLWQFTQMGLFRRGAAQRIESALAHFGQGGAGDALACLQGAREPSADLLRHALQHLQRRKLDAQHLQDELTRFAQAQLNQLRAFLRPLEVIANLAPLLGLFGTVIGMIEAFQAMQRAGSQVDPSVLSGGIWVALLTTAVGLAVAMPAVLLHSWLERLTERTAARMQDSVARLFTLDAERHHDSAAPVGRAAIAVVKSHATPA